MQDTDIITFNVGGKIMSTHRYTINSRPGLLHDMINDQFNGIITKENGKEKEIIFIDEDSHFFRMLLNYYRTGIVDKVIGLSEEVLKFKTDYWGLKSKEDEGVFNDRALIEYFLNGIVKEDKETKGYILHTREIVNPDKLRTSGFKRWSPIIRLATEKVFRLPIGISENMLYYYRFDLGNVYSDNINEIFGKYRQMDKSDIPDFKKSLDKYKFPRDLRFEEKFFLSLPEPINI